MFRIITSFSFFICAQMALALPLPHDRLTSVLVPATMTTDHDFEGIVALSNCSGSLVRFKNSKDTDRALVMTNGHCLESGFPRPGTFVSGQASSRRFNLLNHDASNAGQVNADLVVYATMTRTDMTLYRLRETYADILTRFNIRPLLLNSDHPAAGTSLEIISGFWRKGYRCSVERFVTHLKEADWTWDDSIRYSRPGCEVIGGTSGSPILASGTRTVIGINNTGNEDGESCTRDNPCEVDDQGNISQEQGLAYGQESFWLYSCLNSGNEVDLSTPGCLLPH